MEQMDFFSILVEILSVTINDELDVINAQVIEAKSERKGNVTPEYFSFLNGKLEGLQEAKSSLNEIASTLSENYQTYLVQTTGGADEE